MKGPVLAGHCYGGAGRRSYGDLDVVISRERLGEGIRALEAAGAHLGGDAYLRATARDAGQVPGRLPMGTPLDLHWDLINDPRVRRDFRLRTDQALVRRRTVAVDRRDVPTLDATDTLLHLVSHLAVSGGHRLGWYVDVDRAVRRDGLDEQLLVERAQQARLGLLTRVVLERCRRRLKTPVPDALLDQLDGSRPWRTVGRFVDAVAPLGASPSRPVHGQVYFRATRDDWRHSARAVRGLLPEVRHREREPRTDQVALISLESWDDTWRRNQHLSAQLVAQGLVRRILFVEPPVLGKTARRHSPQPGIDVLRPALPVPKRYGGLALVGAALKATALRDMDVVWVNDPDLGIHCVRPGQPAVYDVTDDWRTFQQAPHVLQRLIAAEDELARSARTIVCSRVLATRWRQRYGVEAAIVHNGVDVDAFAHAVPQTLVGPAPHVGYVGTLHPERVDVDLLLRLAAAPGVGTLHLVGPNHLDPEDTGRLRQMGADVVGPVPWSQVPGWMIAMDVLVCPHLVNDFTLSLDAIKAYEYLAAGRRVVATPSSGFQELGGVVDVADSAGFLESVAAASRCPHRAEVDREASSWRNRALQFHDQLAGQAPSPPITG